ncbi:MAG: 2,4-diaminopentanoate dehydrogenase [Defluviitaleaceae bacterium]|nr:2,4-diaminopentanoate dehydrogenase [Defluviitaleaceae bacterium]MCL2240375.1 2,4-diaminopentanoate dehydrogenase [Defluviitaleaceae bacterium]
MSNIKVALWGFGAMGQGIAKVLLTKKGVEITGVCDINPALVGKGFIEALGISGAAQGDVKITASIEEAVQPKSCDVCILATDSFTAKAFPKMEALIKLGVNVISTAEEMAFPAAQEPELTKKLDELAKAHGVSVLGTGINPGLVMDLLALCLSGAMTDVESVMCKRVNSLSPFGKAVMEEQGVGISVAEFDKGVADGTLAGHVGFAESVAMIATGMGLETDGFKQQMKPIVTSIDRTSPYGFAPAGHLAGVNMTGQGLKNGKVIIDMYHPQQIEPEMEGTHTGDYIELQGNPPISMQITPEIDGGLGTIAMCINCIPQTINADPGVITMLDIPVPRAIMGDFRTLVKPGKRIGE